MEFRFQRKGIVMLYDGTADDDLHTLRHRLYCEKTASGKSFVRAEALPPTSKWGMGNPE
jgi:hypothetical protein